MNQGIAWEFIVAMVVGAAVLLGIIYATFNYNVQANKLENEIQKICIESGGTYVRYYQQCLTPGIPASKVPAQ